MNIYELIEKRQSIRKYEQRPIEREKLERVLRAGAMAPTARNEQAHRITAVTDPEVIAKLAPEMPFVATAPCVLAVFFDGDRMMRCGQSARTVDCTISLSYISLAAVEEGLGGCWLGGFDAENARVLLGLPETATVAALYTLGYPEGDTPRRIKKPAEELYEIM